MTVTDAADPADDPTANAGLTGLLATPDETTLLADQSADAVPHIGSAGPDPLQVEVGQTGHAILLGSGPADEVPAGAGALTSGRTTASSATALAVGAAVADYHSATGGVLDGTGLKIGILSDSFNLHNGEATDIADGDLPAASDIRILKEGTSGNDEGRAMAQLVHAIAPGAEIYFYSGVGGEQDFANGVTALANAGVNEIVDDITYTDEPFYQDTGVITQAVESAIAKGVDYFTAAGNSSDNFYESAFNPMTLALPGLGTVLTHDVGNGSPYEAIQLGADPTLDFTVQWTQPFGSARYDLGVGLYSYDATHGTYTLVANIADPSFSASPTLSVDGKLNVGAGTYYLAFYESGSTGSAPVTPGTFKITLYEDSNATLTGPGAGIGSGTAQGHELAPGVNTVAAVNVAETPSQRVSTPVVEPYSGTGRGATYFDASGNALATPVNDGKPDFAATDGTPTSVFDPFDGTSAAAPNAAAVGLLMLQADPRLAPAQVTDLLEQSAIPTASTTTGGAGLIQADKAVAAAMTAKAAQIWTAQDGTDLWSDPLNWSDGAAPTSASAVKLTDGLGLFSKAYAVEDANSAAIKDLVVDGGSTGAVPSLVIDAGVDLSTGSAEIGVGSIDVLGSLSIGGALAAAAQSSGPQIDIGTRGLVDIGTDEGASILFGGGGTLRLEAATPGLLTSGLTGTISGYSSAGTIDLAGLAYDATDTVAVAGSNVAIESASGTVLARLDLTGSFSGLALANASLVGSGLTGTALVATGSAPASNAPSGTGIGSSGTGTLGGGGGGGGGGGSAAVAPITPAGGSGGAAPTSTSSGPVAAPAANNVTTTLAGPSVTFDPDVSVDGATVTMSGTVSAAAGVSAVDIVSGSTELGAATLGPGGTWTFAFDGAAGFYSGIQAVATDTQTLQAAAPSPFDLTTGVTGEPYSVVLDRYDTGSGAYLGSSFLKRGGALYLESSAAALANGGSTLTYAAGSFFKGKTYSSFVDSYDADGTLTLHTENDRDGSHAVEIDADAQRVQALGTDTFTDNASATRFVFHQGVGQDIIEGFRAAGPGHDTIALPSADASRLASILAHAHGDGQGDATIALGHGDTITFEGISVAALQKHASDFTTHA